MPLLLKRFFKIRSAATLLQRDFRPTERRAAHGEKVQLVARLVLEEEHRLVVLRVDNLTLTRAGKNELAGDREARIGHGTSEGFFAAHGLGPLARLEIRRLAGSACWIAPRAGHSCYDSCLFGYV